MLHFKQEYTYYKSYFNLKEKQNVLFQEKNKETISLQGYDLEKEFRLKRSSDYNFQIF